MIYSVHDDEIIVDIFQNGRCVWANEFQFIDWSSIAVFVHHYPIIARFPCLHSLEQRLLLKNLLKFELFIGLLSVFKQNFHVFTVFS